MKGVTNAKRSPSSRTLVSPIVSLVQHNQIALFARPIVVDFVNGHNGHVASTFPSAPQSFISVADVRACGSTTIQF